MPRNYQNYGEAVVLPTQGVTNMFLQQMERNKLHEQQLNKQIQDNMATYDPNKVRDQDLDGFYKRWQNVKDLSMKYRDAYKNPRGNVDKIRELDAAKNDLMAYINKSKGAKDFQKQVDDLYVKHPDKVNLEDFVSKRNLVSTPLDSPEYDKVQGMNITDFQFNAAKFDPAKFYAPVYKNNPLSIQSAQNIGPNGEILTSKRRIRDLNGTLNDISLGYDADYQGAKKGFDVLFKQSTPEDKAALTKVMQNVIPGFEINTPKDLAIATGMAGKMQVNMGQVQTGETGAAKEGRARRNQAYGAALSQGNWMKRQAITGMSKENKQKWIPLMSDALKTKDPSLVANYIGELSDAAPGVEYGYINKEIYNQDRAKNKDLVKTIVTDRASERDILKADDLNRGFIYAKVPDGKDKNGNVKYKYMIASPSRNDLPNSLNRILNAARGAKKYGNATQYAPVFPAGSLDDVNGNDIPIEEEEE